MSFVSRLGYACTQKRNVVFVVLFCFPAFLIVPLHKWHLLVLFSFFLSHHSPYCVIYLQVVQCKGQREIYLVQDKTRRAFPDFTTFTAMKFTLDDVHLVGNDVFEVIKLGLPLPYKS